MTMTDDTTTQELLISSDSHVKIEHENVKQHLASKFHDAYDKAAGGFAAQMSTGAGAVNQAWETSRKHAPDMAAFGASVCSVPTLRAGLPRHSSAETLFTLNSVPRN